MHADKFFVDEYKLVGVVRLRSSLNTGLLRLKLALDRADPLRPAVPLLLSCKLILHDGKVYILETFCFNASLRLVPLDRCRKKLSSFHRLIELY